MTTRSIRFFVPLLLAVSSGPIFGEQEAPEAHAHGATRTVVLEGSDVRPASLAMKSGDVISFINYSTSPIRLAFTEPKAMADKIRCGLVRDAKTKGAPSAPWALFTWTDGTLTANVPPGQFASVCSFAPGHYAYTAQKVGGAGDASGVLAAKGQIDVQ
jgi:hypothetical protein